MPTHMRFLVEEYFRQIVGIIQIEEMTNTKQPIPPKEIKKRKQVEEPPQVIAKKTKAAKPEVVVETKAEEPKCEEVVQGVIDELISSMKKEQDRVKVQLARLRVLDRSFTKLKADFGKRYNGLASTLEQNTRRKAQSDSKHRAKSGFSKPAPMSDELATFMNLPHGSVVSRTEATKAIISYVKEHKLESPENRRQWNPDEKLSKLLKPEQFLHKDNIPLEPLGYFNVQRCLSHHFTKA
jgi:chromatin remodeling complex protein RSC6